MWLVTNLGIEDFLFSSRKVSSSGGIIGSGSWYIGGGGEEDLRVGRKGCYPNEAEPAASTLLLLYFLIITHHPILLPPKKSNFSDILFLVEIDLWDVREVWRLRSCWCWEKTSYLKEANLPPVHYNHPAHMVSIKDHPIVLSIFPKLSPPVEKDLGSFCELC